MHGPVFRYRAVGAGAVMGAMGAAIRWKPWAGAPAILRTWSIHSLLSFAYLIVMLVDLRTVLLPGKWHSSGFPVLVDLLQELDMKTSPSFLFWLSYMFFHTSRFNLSASNFPQTTFCYLVDLL